MHPTIAYEMAKNKIEEELQYAARQRLARASGSDRPRPIDFSSIGRRLRIRLTGGTAFGGQPTATSNA
jgi:hypothetical protein